MPSGVSYSVIGLMSGTSLDGLDIAFCTFAFDGRWQYELGVATTVPYPTALQKQLADCMSLTESQLKELDKELGVFFGAQTNIFINQNNLCPLLIASHGHTVFHQPDKGLTRQIGDANEIVKYCGVMAVSDFRTENVQLGGQGAPLVPIGDKLLFGEYDFCLNLGGISNVSFDDENGERKAFDISPCNLVLNHYAESVGKPYDESGKMGRKGNLHEPLLAKLNQVDYYQQTGPRSLGKENIVNVFLPLMEQYDISLEDKMRTFYEHIAIQIGTILTHGKTLVTGGGAENTFLMELLSEKSQSAIVKGEKTLTSFKEALLFGFLGVLRIRNEANVLKSYTAASRDCCSGVITPL